MRRLTVAPFATVTIADSAISGVAVFGTSQTLTVTLSSAANGTLSNLDGGSYDAATGVYTVTGSLVGVNTSLHGLLFTPTISQAVVTTTFTIVDNDILNVNVSDSATDSTTTVTVGPVVPPVIAGAVSGQGVIDLTTIAPFANVTISDVNAGQTETVTVTLSAAANGALSNLGGGSYTAATGVSTDTGTAAVTADLDGLVFTPTGQQVPAGQTVATTFTIQDTDTLAYGATDNNTTTVVATAATFNTLVSFNGADGAEPQTTLLLDSAGTLWGETTLGGPSFPGGASNLGTIFQLITRGGVYASTPQQASTGVALLTPYEQLVGGTQQIVPQSALIREVVNGTTYTFFSTFSHTPEGAKNDVGSVLSEADGDVAPKVAAGQTGISFVPQISLVTAKGMFVSDRHNDQFDFFAWNNPSDPGQGDTEHVTAVSGVVTGSMAADAAGNVYGTTQGGSVFELLSSGGSYNVVPIILATFNGTNGADPEAGLISDAAGNLFGTTFSGGAYNDGTVFELVNHGGSFTLVTLASFNGADGASAGAPCVVSIAPTLLTTPSRSTTLWGRTRSPTTASRRTRCSSTPRCSRTSPRP
jgi:uncharacterized repeat protein (TIGR03803 family)